MGQHWVDHTPLGGRLPLYPGEPGPFNPHEKLGNGPVFWSYVALKLVRAVVVVPFVEELLWRGLLLRAFEDWNHYDQVPWGRFSWRAFIGTALLSTVQHPDNWVVSIGCWFLFNGLFYWKKSLLCVMACHAITNLALYAYVLGTSDWRFW
jgi:CAAX prenyl protease-like protein